MTKISRGISKSGAAGISVLAMVLSLVSGATRSFAQSAPDADNSAKDGTASEETIIVTGSRVARAGFIAPTPTTVVGSEEIARKGQTNAVEILAELPSIRAGINGTTAGPALRGATATADLRGLGPVRTLVLVNGLRAVPTQTNGLTDLNLVPAIAIDRVDVVTGGASAGYGSDAVGGIVNFVLKKRYDGISIDFSKGVSRYGDNAETKLAGQAGISFGGDRGRAFFAGEYVKNDGVGDQYTRPWGQTFWGLYTNSAAGKPQRIVLPDVYVANTTLGGIITNATNVTAANLATLKTIAFAPGGSPYTFNFGSPSNASQAVGSVVGSNPGAVTFGRTLALSLPVERFSVYGRAGYDLADGIEFYVAGQAAGYNSKGATFLQRGTVSIAADNAYLPASVRALMNANSVLTVGREFEDSFGPSVSFTKNRTYNGIAGIEGSFGGSWKFDLSFQHGSNTFDQRNTGQVISANLRNAVDAVVSGGQVVCRSTITTPANGCVPFNPFGQGAPSDAAQAYVRGTGTVHLLTKQTQVSANLRGEPFSTWAGPVSVAVGGEYRHESADQQVDAIAAAGGFLTGPVNLKALTGSYSVKEGYLETVVPLARDLPFIKSLEFNGAVRVTDYSTSGTVTTWKLGGSYEPFEGLRFRGTRSRDIRAPNIAELYTVAQTANPNTLINPFTTPSSPAGIVNVVTSGNPSLRPEVANTLTLGVVIQPRQISGLSISVDYYNINLKDAISSYQNQTILNQCAAGDQNFCSLITLGAGNTITQIRNRSINIASLKFRGVDIESTYRISLNTLNSKWGGTLRLGAMASRVIDAISNDGVTGPIQRAGEVGTQGGIGKPLWTVSHTINLEYDHWSVGMQGRYLSGGKYDNTWAEGATGVPGTGGFTVSDNTIPSVYYVNLNASVNVLEDGERKMQLYFVANNVFNKAPPVAPQGGGVTNAALYDVIGQTFKIGARINF